jgi:hypothetical protein
MRRLRIYNEAVRKVADPKANVWLGSYFIAACVYDVAHTMTVNAQTVLLYPPVTWVYKVHLYWTS